MTIAVRGLKKSFGHVHALRGVDFLAEAGSVHALCGENGAGKSTLLAIIAGTLKADEGSVTSDGDVAIVHQELALCGQLTVAENMYLGRERFFIDEDAMAADAKKELDAIGADIDPLTRVADLSVAEAQLVEIARALSKRCRVLLLDEPTAALSQTETNLLLQRVRALANDGATIVYVSHRLEEVLAVADRITVLRDGQSVATFSEADPNTLVRAMVGRDIAKAYPRRRSTIGEKLIEIEGVDVRAGEVLGIAGVMGAGRSELLLRLYDLRRGMALVPEDRKRQGLFFEQDVDFHLTLTGTAAIEGLAMPARELPVRVLSGGNQQKVVLGKAAASAPSIYLLDEPTRGIDVGAKAEIYDWINTLTDAGKAVVLVSSDLPELLGMSDRVLVLRRGKACGVFEDADATTIMKAALGA